MAIGIDLNGDILRFAIGESQDYKTGFIAGIQGVLPRKNEAIVWNNPKALRHSNPGSQISLGTLWKQFLSDPDSRFHWETEFGILQEAPVVKAIADAIVQNLPNCRTSKTIFTVSNLLHEMAQDRLLSAMKNAGIANVELLWRPVAIALTELSSGENHCREDDQFLVVDAESTDIEFTKFELRSWESQLVPKRNLPIKTDRNVETNSSINSFRRAIANNVADENQTLIEQLFTGPFASEFIAFTENLPYSDFWFLTDRSQFKHIEFNQSFIIDGTRTEFAYLKSVLESSVVRVQECEQFIKLWHGLPFRIDPSITGPGRGSILNDDAVSIGAMIYGDKLEKGQPTYLDMLPGLEVLSQSTETNTFNFYPLIPEGEIQGGTISKLDEPLSGFNLKDEIDKFNIVLRTIHDGKCKRLTTKLPNSKRGGDIPLLIRAEMRPAQGNALVTIEGSPGNEDVFGEIRRIKLDWHSIEEEFEIDEYSGPEVYPVIGRIFDDPDCLDIVRLVIENDMSMTDKVKFLGGTVPFNKVFEPWGYKSPLGAILRQPTRGLFGAKPSDNIEIQELAQSLANIINQEGRNNRYKHLNQLFRFTPDWFLEDLRNVYTAERPPIDNWNMAFAPGRVFFKIKDFELFLDFIIRFSKTNGYPDYPDESYVAKYYWSFFRALCYYEDTAYTDSKKIERVLNTLHRYISSRARENWAPRTGETDRWSLSNVENVKKFCLCAILFSLRHRKKNKIFLKPNTPAWNVIVEDVLEKFGRVQYPKAMFAFSQPDCLNDYVYRFLACNASKQDFSALEGLTTSMS